MTKIAIVKNTFYKLHYYYDDYGASLDGRIINIIKKNPMVGNRCHNGYITCSVKNRDEWKWKSYQIHRFIWECWRGVIPDGKVIDHKNNDKEDNRLCNLQLLTHQENCKKSAKNRNYKFASKNHQNRKCVKAINKTTNEVSYFNSLHAVNQHLNINVGIVKMCCEGLNNCKSGKSKKDGHSYTFEYIKEEDLPDNHFKSANIRPQRVSNEDKKKHQKEAGKNG